MAVTQRRSQRRDAESRFAPNREQSTYDGRDQYASDYDQYNDYDDEEGDYARPYNRNSDYDNDYYDDGSDEYKNDYDDNDYESSRWGHNPYRGSYDEGRGYEPTDRDHMREIARMGRDSRDGNRGYDYNGYSNGDYSSYRSPNSRKDYDYNNSDYSTRNSNTGNDYSDYDSDGYNDYSSRRRSDGYGNSRSYGSGTGFDRGYASMNRDHVREIARKGSRASNGGRSYDYDNSYSQAASSNRRGSRGRSSGSHTSGSGRGFASMRRDRVREIARMGGHASHGGGRTADRYHTSSNGSSRKGGYATTRSSSSKRRQTKTY